MDDIRVLLPTLRVIAVIGFSPRPTRPSNNLSRQMQRFGLRIIPIRPGISEGLGEPAYASLSDMPPALQAQVDLVNVFRDSRYVPDIVEESLALGMKARVLYKEPEDFNPALGYDVIELEVAPK
jgi:predicted CoA-binding protein